MKPLDKMTYKELMQQRRRIDARLAEARDAEKEKIRAKARKLADEAGFDLKDVVGGNGAAKKRGPKAGRLPKYAHKDDPARTCVTAGAIIPH